MKNSRKFELSFEMGDSLIDSAIVEIDQELIDVVDDDWRSVLYDLHTPEEIAEHIGYNLIINNIHLSQMDGWADKDNDLARVVKWPDLDGYWITAREIKGGKYI